ncbi:hypothetical protein [Vibrio sp. WXL103]|uniref:hypothetical protein n=1 Tax=Vibrio sp. WXL103 TaxID=3450710 RepID=UPI003EC730F7
MSEIACLVRRTTLYVDEMNFGVMMMWSFYSSYFIVVLVYFSMVDQSHASSRYSNMEWLESEHEYLENLHLPRQTVEVEQLDSFKAQYTDAIIERLKGYNALAEKDKEAVSDLIVRSTDNHFEMDIHCIPKPFKVEKGYHDFITLDYSTSPASLVNPCPCETSKPKLDSQQLKTIVRLAATSGIAWGALKATNLDYRAWKNTVKPLTTSKEFSKTTYKIVKYPAVRWATRITSFFSLGYLGYLYFNDDNGNTAEPNERLVAHFESFSDTPPQYHWRSEQVFIASSEKGSRCDSKQIVRVLIFANFPVYAQ